MSDIITRLLLKTNDFDANLERSKGSVNSFQGGISNMAKSVGSSFVKVAGGIGLVVSAGEGFTKLLNSSQTLGDQTAAAMMSAKTGVDEFFYSLGSGDFTSFLSGMDDIIAKSKEAHGALDQLGNTEISFDYFQGKFDESIAQSRLSAKNKQLGNDERDQAFKDWDNELKKKEEAGKTVAADALNALTKSIVVGTKLSAKDISLNDFDKVMEIDLMPSAVRSEAKDYWGGQYKEYLKLSKKIESDRKVDVVRTNDYGKTKSINDAARIAQEGLAAKYKNAVMYNKLLNKLSDDDLRKVTELGKKYYATSQQIAQQRQEFNESTTEFGNSKVAAEKASAAKAAAEPKKDSIAWYDAEIAKLNKKLIATTDEQAKTTIKTTINELEAKKIKLQVETSGNSIEAINIQLADLNKKLISATDMQARSTIQATINELEQKKINLKFVVDQEAFKIKNGGMKDGALSVPIAPAYDKVPTHGKGGKNFKLPKYNPLFKKEDVDLNEDYANSLSAIGGVMSSLSGITDNSAASYLQWGANVMSSVGQAIQSITKLIAAKEAEAVINGVASATETPVVGWLLAGAAVASVLAAMASVPKFAAGGIVPGASFTGDKVPALLNSGEMILNGSQQSNLFKMLNSGLYGSLSQKIAPSIEDQNVRLYSDVEIRGDRIFLALHNHIKKTGKKLW
ncbi:hypothetical protein [Bacteroides sp.]|uniref:hypothetical protein n=1 Tax=Bacteroides sp. TaxID=29523 RepID=UPI002A8216C0|nr:hypothetical protein [Bacteroides sp.]